LEERLLVNVESRDSVCPSSYHLLVDEIRQKRFAASFCPLPPIHPYNTTIIIIERWGLTVLQRRPHWSITAKRMRKISSG